LDADNDAAAVAVALSAISAGPVVSVNGAGGVIAGVTMNANNLSDMIAPATALSNIGGVPTSSKGVAYGVASLNAVGQVPNAQLPVFSVNGRVGAVTTAAADITDSGTTGRAIVQASTTSEAQTAIGATSLGSQVLTSVNQSQALGYLGGTTVGQAVFQAVSASGAATAIGATTIGSGLLTAATTADALTAIGGTTVGNNVLTAANAGAAQTALGGTTVGNAVFTAADAPTALAAIGAEPAAIANGISYQTTNYTLQLSDAGKIVEMYLAGANTVTIPPNSSVAFPYGVTTPTRVDIVQLGAGVTTIVAGAGVTLWASNGYLIFSGQFAGATLYKRAINTWVVMGSLI
jgi:hypothetical protein